MVDKMMRVAGRGLDGTAKALRVDNLGNVNTVHKGGLTSTKRHFRIGSLEPKEEPTEFIELSKETIVHNLQFMFENDDPNVYVIVDFWGVLEQGENSNWKGYTVLTSTQTATNRIRPSVLENDNLFIANENNIYLQQELHVRGIRIRLFNTSEEPVNLSCSILWSEV